MTKTNRIFAFKEIIMLKIDMHTHILPETLPDFGKKFGVDGFIHIEKHRPGFAKMMRGDTFFREVEANCWDADIRIDEYATHRTQVQVICTVPVLFSYWAKPEHTLELSKFLNDDIAQVVQKYPKNYIGLGTIPMQDTNLAISELERCKSIGLVGIQIGSNVNQINLHDARFFPIWEACQDLNMAVMIHPWEMMGEKDIQRYWLPWLVGMPAETTRAICSMILGGVFDKFPKLRVNFSHAGGSFLFTLGRIEHGFNCRPDLVAIDNPNPPSSYLGKFWVDSITHDPDMLLHVIKKVGIDKVTLGSDYPFPLGDLEIGKMIEDMNFSEVEQEKLLSKNTFDWLQLRAEDFV